MQRRASSGLMNKMKRSVNRCGARSRACYGYKECQSGRMLAQSSVAAGRLKIGRDQNRALAQRRLP